MSSAGAVPFACPAARGVGLEVGAKEVLQEGVGAGEVGPPWIDEVLLLQDLRA
jgi:hypothetical protein